jgi:hypothetical protein
MGRITASTALWLLIAPTTMEGSGFPQTRQVAITFDDLPVAQSGASACNEPGLSSLTKTLLAPFQAQRIPSTAFVIGSRCSELTFE